MKTLSIQTDSTAEIISQPGSKSVNMKSTIMEEFLELYDYPCRSNLGAYLNNFPLTSAVNLEARDNLQVSLCAFAPVIFLTISPFLCYLDSLVDGQADLS